MSVPPVTYGIHPFVVPQIGKKNPAFSARLFSESLQELEYWDGVISPEEVVKERPTSHRILRLTDLLIGHVTLN